MIEWGVKYHDVYAYESEDEARRQLNLAQWDVPAILVSNDGTGWKPAD